MTSGRNVRVLGTTLAVGGLAAVLILVSSPGGRAQDQGNESDSRIEQGFEIAPVHLNLEGKNPALVGLGSYIVNTEGCNDCHDAGPPTQYARGGNPFFGQPKKVNAATYMGGGRAFPPLIPCDPKATPPIPCPATIISRNLTPTPKTGLPEGDHTFEQFLEIFRKGTDFDHLHPTCPPGTLNSSCIPAPFDGNLLQIMPWPNFKDLTDHEIRAIYEYLSAIPCVRGNYPGPAGLAEGITPEPADRCN